MKISKSTQRRVVALFVLVCLMLLPNLIISVLHVVLDKDWRTTNQVTLVGTLDVRRPSYMLGEGQQSLYTPTVIREATEDSPAIMAEHLIARRVIFSNFVPTSRSLTTRNVK